MMLSCLRPKTETAAAPKYFEDWEDSERIRLVMDYTRKYHLNEIRQVQRATNVPWAVIYTFLTIERYNDWKVGHTMNAYQDGDLMFRVFGGKRSLGPANVGLSAVEYVYEKSKNKYFKNGLTPEQAYLKIPESEFNSIYWGTVYLKTIYDELLTNDPDKPDCKKWVKAIGLYNEGLGNVKGFVCGDYSKRVDSILTKAYQMIP